MTTPLDERTRWLHGTVHKRQSGASTRTPPPRLMQPIPPPRDLPDETKRQWRLHMAQITTSGRASTADLVAFRELCFAAHAVEIARAAAMETGPTEEGQNGERKASTAWRMWLATMAAYRSWLDAFGLTPRGRVGLPQLSAPAAELHVVEIDR